MKLLFNALAKLALGFVLLGAMLFWPAGTIAFPGAWLFLGLLFVPMLILGAVLLIKAPALLKKRLDHKEKERAQRGVLAFAAVMFPATFILSALDFRRGWSEVPIWLTLVGAALFLLGFLGYCEVLRENAYLSRTVTVQEGQRVIDTGLYGVVRHPMYLATLLMFLPLPLILGSYWALCPMAIYPLLLIVRIQNEERVLLAGLDGYADYRRRVRWRLVPLLY